MEYTKAAGKRMQARTYVHLLIVAGLSLNALPYVARAAQSGIVTPAAPYRAPYQPTANDEILQQVPAAADPDVRHLQQLRATLDSHPDELSAVDELARAYIDFGREVGDAHYAGYAEAVLRPWLDRTAVPSHVLIDEATILQFRHQFKEARQLLRRTLSQDASNAQAWLTLATIDMVQGDYAEATHDCSQVAVTGGTVVSIACTANLHSYLGQAQQSIVLLNQIAGDVPSFTPVLRSWIQGLLAESAERLGDWPQVEEHYRKALALTPKDNFLLVAYADFLLDRQRPQEVLTLLRDSSQSDTAFLRLALAKAALHSPDLSQYTWIMGARFEALSQRGSDYFGREQVRSALYLQRDAKTALDLAERNWQVQRAPWDARVFLEAALAANEPHRADAAATFIRETHLQDPVIAQLLQQMPPSSARAAATATSAP